MRFEIKKGDILLYKSHLPTTPDLIITVDRVDSDYIYDVNGTKYLKREINNIYNQKYLLNRK